MKNFSPVPFAGLKNIGSPRPGITRYEEVGHVPRGNHDTPLQFDAIAQPVQTQIAVETVVPVITEQVSVTVPPPARTDALVASEHWEWQQVRDFVVGEITAKFGAFPRNQMKEAAIFKSFTARFGADAAAIVKFAFGPACKGWWGNAPISVNRFCVASDVYFGQPILDRLRDAR